MSTRHNNVPTLVNLSIQEAIASVPFLSELPAEALEPVLAHAAVRNHPANQTILLENDWGSSVYFVLSGWLKIRTYNADGREITLNIVGRGEIVGEMAALEQVPRSTDVLSLTPATIVNIPAEDFVRLLKTEPLAGMRLAQLMARRLRQVNRRLRLRESNSASRVADTLLFLVEGQGKTVSEGISIPNLPHRELSSMSGLARETVTRVLTKMEAAGLIARHQDILLIPDVAALEASIV
ncbi:Crp/Fnr family transcriptional regulator [Chamaesiphon sp. VAR_48_metabat_135_sub]|uniref:Crp/Fnr family transcriptional regulator n=1 Tax=Chamaesiphon sp. VAR_48_metabat_135_sub TaxID=2964699 RepID=UPI00286B1F28|nr:Crp/Fnr family transcriptional regulator [Chamaesiphon sp. VAR_48_metabat_135_sub]